MSLVLYNTLTRRKEPFAPLAPGRAAIYVCGPTVYDYCHVGHARCYVAFDVLVRYLKALGYEVTYVRNITDLDDKIIRKANDQGLSFFELAETYIRAFHQDMDALGLLRPNQEPRATEHIDHMVADIRGLVERGYAYQGGGDVFYEVGRFADYGLLSGRDLTELRAGARVEVDPHKKSPLDFVLWKQSKPGEPAWPSPWGEGRPGWHLECSAMSSLYLGAAFDLHGGGHDLIFPHHENEIAQAVPLGRGFARAWMHNGFVQINHQKMSKSLKNFFTIREVLARFHPEALRLFVLSKQYRGPLDFSDEALSEAGKSLDRAYQTLKQVRDLAGPAGRAEDLRDAAQALARIREAMDDDLNTARALGHLFDAVRALNRLLDEGRDGEPDLGSMRAWSGAVRDMGQVLGLLVRDPAAYLAERQDTALSDSDLTPAAIEACVAERARARAEKRWADADRIRGELQARGVVLEDVGGRTRWRLES
jgi:cysteinyl-tRNA synthetase